MTLYRVDTVDTPGNPFTDGPDALRWGEDQGLVVDHGVITDRGPWAVVRERHPGLDTEDLRGGILLPGFVDTHVHYPQIRIIGGLGRPLLDWLEHRALPEEARLADVGYARQVAAEFCAALLSAGTTSALVFGSHYAPAMEELFGAAERTGLRMTSGLVVSDRLLRPDLLTEPHRAREEGQELLTRWHGRGRLRYAVTPRFSLAATDELLAECGRLATAAPGVGITSHLNENRAEIAHVQATFPQARHYLDSYARHGLVTDRTVLAHNVHPTDAELQALAAAGAWVAHCPTSNAALGSGVFPMRRHVAAGVGVALGSDVGAGTGFCLFKEGLQAFFAQQVVGEAGYPMTAAHLLYLATMAGARALGLSERVGDLSVGKEFDALWVRPVPGSAAATVLTHAEDLSDAVTRLFSLATPADIAQVWIGGQAVSRP